MAKRFKQFWKMYWHKLWELMILNLLTLLCCVPIITIGPVLAGMTKVIRAYYLEKSVFLVHEFFKGFKENWKKSGIIGLFDLFVLFSFVTGYRVYTAMGSSIPIFLLGVTYVVAAGVFVMNFYIFPMIVTTDLSLRDIIKNSFILTVAALPRNFITLVIIALVTIPYIFLVLANPFFVLLFFLFYVTGMGFMIFFRSYPIVQKYVIDPFYALQNKTNPEYGEDYDISEALFSDRYDNIEKEQKEQKSDKS
ncbi:MAG: DUF624 domain-containing protein [Ruminococcus sp.]|jgi:uncharacterized membrane protein YesL|nr:DUF624 domain-containing protein [Ruminococcus sp.]